MWGLELYERAWKEHHIREKIKEIRSKCENCKGTGSISYGIGGGSGCFSYSISQLPCSKCGFLELDYGLVGEFLIG